MFRSLVQIVFFTIFLVLLVTGKAQFWLAFVLISILMATFTGRFYCGWACPINTLMRPTTRLAQKFGLASRPVSKLFKSEKPRIGILLVFLVGLAYTIYSITQGKKFPLPLIVIPFGLVTTVLFSPTTWHRYLCPWGTLFSFTSRFSRLKLQNKPSSCVECGKCSSVCPSDTIIKLDKRVFSSDNSNCLMCFQCKNACPHCSIHLTRKDQLNKKGSTYSV